MSELRNCHDCGAKPGELHKPGCDTERCPRCGYQAIGCECVYVVNGLVREELETRWPEIYVQGPTEEMMELFERAWGPRRLPWTGEWPGDDACREFGFWSVWGPDMVPPQRGWVPVPTGTPGAGEDLNTLMEKTRWNPVTQKRELR